jgi:hypothetical protein
MTYEQLLWIFIAPGLAIATLGFVLHLSAGGRWLESPTLYQPAAKKTYFGGCALMILGSVAQLILLATQSP